MHGARTWAGSQECWVRVLPVLLTCCVTLGKPLLLSGLLFALLQNAQLGPCDLLLMLLPPCDSQPPRLVQDVAPHPPRGLPASHTLHSRRNTLPLSCPSSAWQALGCREDGRWGNGPSSSGLRGESWPVASHNSLEIQRAFVWGPNVSSKPSLLRWPRRSTSTGFAVKWAVGAAQT